MLPQQVLDNTSKIIDYVKGLGIDVAQIKDKNLLLQAFVHKSFAADFKEIADHNERLEFLGDGILGSIVNTLLFIDHPEMSEADMTLYKIALVREEILAEVAKEIKLDENVFISKGEEGAGGRQKDAILSDTLEAFIGYMYIDLGLEATKKFISTYIYSHMDHISTEPVKSYKTLAQEHIQKLYKQIPEYKDIEHELDDKGNPITYKTELYVQGKKEAEGFGVSKKKAQEDAAKNFWENVTE